MAIVRLCAYTEKMDDALLPGRLARLIADRDEAYAVMRRLVPQLDTGPVVPAQLTGRQREVVEKFERLDALAHEARGHRHRVSGLAEPDESGRDGTVSAAG